MCSLPSFLQHIHHGHRRCPRSGVCLCEMLAIGSDLRPFIVSLFSMHWHANRKRVLPEILLLNILQRYLLSAQRQ
jgi:hypothetical protein